jgi:ABC-2 type transport system ATP-binding protein
MENHEIVFNQTIENISKKLLFKHADRDEKSQELIYEMETLRGVFQLCKIPGNVDSNLDIELLFNAVLINNKTISTLFN